MNFRQLKTNQVALLLHGLRMIYVHEDEADRQKLLAALEAELSSRGLRLAD